MHVHMHWKHTLIEPFYLLDSGQSYLKFSSLIAFFVNADIANNKKRENQISNHATGGFPLVTVAPVTWKSRQGSLLI